jgi:hypothetical protein
MLRWTTLGAYIGAVCRNSGETVNIRRFGVTNTRGTDCNAPSHLLIGTSSDGRLSAF